MPTPTHSISISPVALLTFTPRRRPPLLLNPKPREPNSRTPLLRAHAVSVPGAVSQAVSPIQSIPPSWHSALLSNLIFVLGSPFLVSGLSLSGFCAAFLLGTLTWLAFGPSGFLPVASYFVIGTAVTKVKMAEKEAQGVAEKKKGRRGPGSVIGSGAAGCICACLTIYGVGGKAFSQFGSLGLLPVFVLS